jgi:flagellar hook-basal body complex protein FliE
MTASYSKTPLATNSLDYKPNLIEVNKQQASEVKSETSFTQKLQDALSPKSDKPQNAEALATSASAEANAEGSVDIGLMDVAPAAMNIGMGLASGNPVAAGLAGTDLLQSVLRADIEKQFTELGQGIAAALVAGMSGDPSATQVLPTAEELAEQAALASADIVAEGSQQIAAASQTGSAATGVSQEGKSVPTKGSIPKAMLDAENAPKNDELLKRDKTIT